MKRSGFDPVSAEAFSKRFRIVGFLIIAVTVALVMRLWLLQIVNGPSYRIQSENNRIHLQDIPSLRGLILDRNGRLLVANEPSFDLYVIPEEIQDPVKLFSNLRYLVGIIPEQVEKRLDGNNLRYPFKPVLLKKDITSEQLALVETHLFNLPGVLIQVRPKRHYLFGPSACHLIGYMGQISENQLKSGKYPENKAGDLIGKCGVEKKWEKYLNGLRGGEQVEVDAAGRTLKVVSRKPPVPGQNIFLTIDSKLQFLAEKNLKGKKGAIVAMNPNNGEVLAMASSPTFDPNRFVAGIDRTEWNKMVSSKDYPLQNRAISGLYPPGSVFKIVVALAGLQEGLLDPEEEVFCNGRYRLGDHTYRCWKKWGHGEVSLHRGLVESCDVYFYTMGRRLGIDKMAYYAKMLGLGRPTGFELGFEKQGLVPTREWKLKRWGIPWQAGETISMAIGQSFLLVTPLQMASMISAVFNGGYLYRPKVIERVGKNGKDVYHFKPDPMGHLQIKEENLMLVRKALIGVVNEPHGTGRRARLKRVIVAGKTGTAQVINLETEKGLGKKADLPSGLRDHAWFVAVAPAEHPVLALAILIENGGHGGSAAAPIAKRLFKAYLEEG
ncbi:MAG: penicillin-binding protein 2 [Deltaproteobacteria bacterium]|nr:penicillin-binding protein 2 [Deltaproteobacteria bacterium]MBW2043646.1 penicillin-binding protein 2 [Deltaproteobacteria bacterium]MBW2300464.1 penicillin-binding protein 2 [Deltaproteobacteria bacterium]